MPQITASRPGNCADCNKPIDKGEKCRWFPKIGLLCLTPCKKQGNVVAFPGARQTAAKPQRRKPKAKPQAAQQVPPPANGYESAADTAKRIRLALKAAFPDIKFSVRSESFSMGSSVNVGWTDGPTAAQVERVADRYEDVSRDDATGEILSGGNRYVHCNRSHSVAFMTKAAEAVCSERGLPVPKITGTDSYAYVDQNDPAWRASLNDWDWRDLSQIIDQRARAMSASDAAKAERVAAVAKARAESPELAAAQNKTMADKLRRLADGMQGRIDQKRDPGISHQNVTARRARIAANMGADADRLEEIQTCLRALAGLWEAGSVPSVLQDITTRAAVEKLHDGYGVDKNARAALLALLTPKPIDPMRQIKEMERELIGRVIPGYFPTPNAVVERMLEEAGIEPSMSVLEPSAGKGNIADAITEAVPGANLEAVECSGALRKILAAKGHNVVGDDFLRHSGAYDRIIMNPPFEQGQDVEHVRKAYDLLTPGGRLVAIMSESPFFRQDRKYAEFRDWLEVVGGTSEKLPEGSFKSSERPTGVACRLVVIDAEAGATSRNSAAD